MEQFSVSYQNYQSNTTVNIILLILGIITIIGTWRVFVKAGVPGWHSLIPILSTYDICKIAMTDNVVLFTVLSILCPVVYIYPCLKLAKAFGKGTGFGVCLFLFYFIAFPVLGFGDAEYLGPQ